MPLFAKKKSSKEDLREIEKFEQLYHTYRQLLYYVAYSILHDIQLSEDAVQQAFLRVFGHLDKISEIECPQTKSFLVIIVKNIAINLYNARRSKATVSFDEIEGWTALTAADEIEEQEGLMELSAAMQQLPQSYRDVLLLRFDNGYSTAEIAQMLGIQEENVKKRIQRARQKLGACLKEEEVTPN